MHSVQTATDHLRPEFGAIMPTQCRTTLILRGLTCTKVIKDSETVQSVPKATRDRDMRRRPSRAVLQQSIDLSIQF